MIRPLAIRGTATSDRTPIFSTKARICGETRSGVIRATRWGSPRIGGPRAGPAGSGGWAAAWSRASRSRAASGWLSSRRRSVAALLVEEEDGVEVAQDVGGAQHRLPQGLIQIERGGEGGGRSGQELGPGRPPLGVAPQVGRGDGQGDVVGDRLEQPEILVPVGVGAEAADPEGADRHAVDDQGDGGQLADAGGAALVVVDEAVVRPHRVEQRAARAGSPSRRPCRPRAAPRRSRLRAAGRGGWRPRAFPRRGRAGRRCTDRRAAARRPRRRPRRRSPPARCRCRWSG